MTKMTIEGSIETDEKTYECGDWFIADGDLCQLVQIEAGQVILNVVRNGNRLFEGIYVKNVLGVTEEEIMEMAGGGDFIPVTEINITYN